MNKKLILFYGPNGSGKTTVARYLATKNGGLHIQLDWFSSMLRGKEWHTKKNNKDKIYLLLGSLDSAMKNTKYKDIYIDGVLIYIFMFKMIEDWCKDNNIDYKFIKLSGNETELNYRVKKRIKKQKKDWNKELPKIYKKITYKNSREIITTNKTLEQVIKELTYTK